MMSAFLGLNSSSRSWDSSRTGILIERSLMHFSACGAFVRLADAEALWPVFVRWCFHVLFFSEPSGKDYPSWWTFLEASNHQPVLFSRQGCQRCGPSLVSEGESRVDGFSDGKLLTVKDGPGKATIIIHDIDIYTIYYIHKEFYWSVLVKFSWSLLLWAWGRASLAGCRTVRAATSSRAPGQAGWFVVQLLPCWVLRFQVHLIARELQREFNIKDFGDQWCRHMLEMCSWRSSIYFVPQIFPFLLDAWKKKETELLARSPLSMTRSKCAPSKRCGWGGTLQHHAQCNN